LERLTRRNSQPNMLPLWSGFWNRPSANNPIRRSASPSAIIFSSTLPTRWAEGTSTNIA
jgi:hypothetical protein